MNSLSTRWGALLTFAALGSALAAPCAPEPQYRPLAEATGKQYGLPAWMLSALVQAESQFCSKAVSSTGAQGLGQLMPGTARDLGVQNSFDPAQNLSGAARYLRAQYLSFGSWPLALAAYNAGPGAVIEYQGIPPYAETQDYVQKVLRLYTAYSGQPPVITASAAQGARKLTIPAPGISGGVAVPAPVPVPASRSGAVTAQTASSDSLVGLTPVAATKSAPDVPISSPAPTSTLVPTTLGPLSITSLAPPRWLAQATPAPQSRREAPQQEAVQAATPVTTSPATTTLRRAETRDSALPGGPVITTVLRRNSP